MKEKIIPFVITVLLFSCNNSSEESFLKNFTDKEKYNPTDTKQAKEINSEDLHFLNKAEAINEFELETGKKYYYGYKKAIGNDYYLLYYDYKYHIDNNFHPFALGITGKSYVCVYQKGSGIISKLKVATGDHILSRFEEKDGIYTIKSISAYLKYDEQKNGFYPFLEKDTIISKYKIENNRFVEIK